MGDHSSVSYKSSVRSTLSKRTANEVEVMEEDDKDPPYTFLSNFSVAQNVYTRNIRSSGSNRSTRYRSSSPSTTIRPQSSVSSSTVRSQFSRPVTVSGHSSSSRNSNTNVDNNTIKSPPRSPDIERINNLSRPRTSRDKFVSNGMSKTSWDWIEHQGRQTPSAQYDTNKALTKLEQSGGGKFNKSQPKSDLEWKIYYAKSLPSPGQYDIKPKKTSGGCFSTAKPKTDIEWKIYNAGNLPGPGLYSVDAAIEKPSGGKFNLSKPKTDLDWTIHRAKKLPGPGEYKQPSQKTSGGSFSTAKPKTDIEWQIYNAKQLPSGESYETDLAHKKREKPGGGKFNMSKPKSEFDWKIYNAQKLPGPGDYVVSSPTKTSHRTPLSPQIKQKLDDSGKIIPFF
mmetsp:Transcript_37407/g.48402  ORF Transcript_37407/g.48402 Transcript_37407/m.48402 type:complete len:394 (-) Transcript_37407:10-1191(-)